MGLDGGDDSLKENLYAVLFGGHPHSWKCGPRMRSYFTVIESETADISVSVRRATEMSF